MRPASRALSTALAVSWALFAAGPAHAQGPGRPKTFTVTVYRLIDGAWKEQPDRALTTTDARAALRYATSFRIKTGWSASTDAAEDVSHCRLWRYQADERGAVGSFVKRAGRQWEETKDGQVVFHFEEVRRTTDFIELYDASRQMSLRLYATEVLWRTPDKEDWFLLPFAVEAVRPATAAVPTGRGVGGR
jgi:hypothetical protein